MEPESTQDLFEIKLTEVGRNYILKSARIAGAVLMLGTINSLITLLGSAVRLSKLSSDTNSGEYWRNFGVIGCLIVIGMTLNVFAIFKYYSFIKNLKKSLIKIDEKQFSLSFKFLFQNIVFFLLVVVLSFLDTAWFFLGPSSPLY